MFLPTMMSFFNDVDQLVTSVVCYVLCTGCIDRRGLTEINA